MKGTNLDNINTAEELGLSIGYTNEEFFKFAKQADLSGDVLEQYKVYMQSASTATSKFAATLKSVAANIGIMLAINGAIRIASAVWDAWNVTVEESQEKIDNINSRIEELNINLSELRDKQDKTSFDNQRIEQLEQELDLQERLLEIEQKRLYQNQIGTDISDLFDADSLISKKFYEENRQNKDSYEFLHLRFKVNESDLQKLNDEINALNDFYNNQADNEAEQEYTLNQINKATEKRNKLLETQTEIEEQLTLNSAEYLQNYQVAQEAIDSGLLTGDDLKKAQEMADYWGQMYSDAQGIITNIQKETGTYDASKNIQNRLSGILAKVDFQETTKQLEELGRNGELSVDTLSSKFPELIEYLDKAGISAQELYQYIMALADPDAVNYNNVYKQFKDSLGFGSIANEDEAQKWQQQWEEILKLGEQEVVLEAYLQVRDQYGVHPEGWTVIDWLSHIQSELEQQELEVSVALDASTTISQLNERIKPSFDSLKSAYHDIFTDDGFALNDIDIISTCETIKFKLDEMSELNLNVDYSAYEDFIRVLSNIESTEQDVEDAFDFLATAITQAGLSGIEDFQTMKAALEDLGVINNELVAFDTLISNTEALKEAGLDLVAVSQMEADEADAIIEAFASEMVSADNLSKAIAMLTYQKELFNLQEMNTANEVANLLTLAENAGYTGEVIQYLTELEQIYQTVASGVWGTNTQQVAMAQQRASELQTLIANAATQIEYKTDVDYSKIGGGSKAAGSAGKAAGDEFVSQFEDELSHLQDLRDRGVISEAEYLRRLRELYTRYFADRKEYLDQFQKYERQYLEGMKSLYDSALSGISTLFDRQIDGYSEAKSAAVDSLTAEKEARLAVIDAQKEQLQAQIDLIDEQIKHKQDIIDGIQKEIDAMKEANAERKRQIDLQKAQYELERMQHQRTILQYSEEKGMHYVNDTNGIRDAKDKVDDAKFEIEIAAKEKEIKLIEDEIELLEKQKDAIQDQIKALDKQADSIEKYYSKMIEQTEKYYDSLIKNIEKQKSKWEELAEIEKIAEAYSAVEQVFGEMGYTVEDVLNGNTQAFEDFKAKYISLMSDMNSNTSFAEGLSYASGVAKEELGSFLDKTKETADGLDTLGGKASEIDPITQSIDNLYSSASTASQTVSDTATNLDTAATNAGTLRDNLTDVNTAIFEEQTAFSDLKQKIDEVVEAINEKITAIQDEQNAVNISTSREMADFLLLRDKILEVKESIDEVGTTVTDLDAKTLDNITNSFQLLHDKIILVSGALGSGIEGSGEGVTNSIFSAIQALNDISLEEGIIAQFNNLKTAIDSVTSAISGGGGESSGGEGQGGQSGSGGSGSKSGSQGSESGNSLSSAITQMGETANEVIGEPEAEGDGTVIGEFGSLKTAVNEVSEAIGIGGEEGTESGGGQGEDDGTLIGSITNLGATSEEVLGESGGDGVIGRFEEFRDVIGEANEHVTGISEGLAAIDGQEVECTIRVNIETTGGLPAFAEGTLGNMNLEGAEYNAKYGKAYATGYQGLPKSEKNALVSEYGQPEMTVFPNGETVITDSPTMMDLPKGTVIFNEDQTRKIMNGKPNVGTAHAQGTADDGVIITPDGRTLRPLQPGDSMWDLIKKAEDYMAQTGDNIHELLSPINSIHRDMEQMAQSLSTINNVNNNTRMQQIDVGGIEIICPGVTSQEVVRQIENGVNNLFNGFHLNAYQQSKIR